MGSSLTLGLATQGAKSAGAKALARLRARPAASPWNLGNFARGFAIEEKLFKASGLLGKNFPKIDRYGNGVATSIKSIDLTASSYQSTSALSRKLTGYVDDLASLNGRILRGKTRLGSRIQIDTATLTGRELIVAIEPGAASLAQRQAMRIVALRPEQEASMLSSGRCGSVPRFPLRRAVQRLRPMSPTTERSGDRSSVEAYVVPGRIILTAMTPLDVAAWTSTDAIVEVDDGVPDDDLGVAVADMLTQSLTASRFGGDAAEQALLEAAKVRSYTALVRTARYVSVKRDGDGPVLMLPAAPGRRSGGWITVPREEGIVVSDASPSALGAALRTAIEQSTTTPVDD